MNFHESRNRIEFKKAQADYDAKVRRLIEQKLIEKGIYIDDIYDIIKHSPDQPRDENGRWTDGGNAESDSKSAYIEPTLNLPPKEYAKVCSEISTYYYSRFEGKDVANIFVGNYEYRFEIRTYGAYNIYGKEEIK